MELFHQMHEMVHFFIARTTITRILRTTDFISDYFLSFWWFPLRKYQNWIDAFGAFIQIIERPFCCCFSICHFPLLNHLNTCPYVDTNEMNCCEFFWINSTINPWTFNFIALPPRVLPPIPPPLVSFCLEFHLQFMRFSHTKRKIHIYITEL